jgi:AcrR family transcriptional regulator
VASVGSSPEAPDPIGARRAGAGRPLRRDAERNRQRILAAAASAFAAGGLHVTMDDIAGAAGLGVGTVYRRFPDKTQLIEALFDARIQRTIDVAERAGQRADAWEGLVYFLEQSLEVEATDRGLAELIRSGVGGGDVVRRSQACIAPLVATLLRRAQDAGQVRADLATSDLAVMKMMLLAVAHQSDDVAPGLWRRYLALMLDSIRTHPERPSTALPVTALSPEQHAEAVHIMRQRRRH